MINFAVCQLRFRDNPMTLSLILQTLVFAHNAVALTASCLHNPAYREVSPIVQKARVYGNKDRRKEFTTEVAQDMKFNKVELNQLNKMIGLILCAPEPGFKLGVATAFIMAGSQQMFTATHVLVSEDGRKRDLSKCKFINYANPREKFELDPKNANNKIPDWSGTAGSGRYDRAKVMLRRPVTGAKPLLPDKDPESIAKGTPVYMFASQHNDFDSSGNRPVISTCNADETTDLGSGVFQLKTDCDAGGGASGGPVLARRNGQLVIEGMNVAEANGWNAANAPFDRMNNYQSVLSIKGDTFN